MAQTTAVVPGGTDISRAPTAQIAQETAQAISGRRSEDACSRLMDLYLESKEKFNAVVDNLQDRVPLRQWSEFQNNYLTPSRQILDEISNAGLAANSLNLSVSAQSAANLRRLGMEVQPAGEDNLCSLRFAPDVRGSFGGRELSFAFQKLTLDRNTQGLSLVEGERGSFMLTIVNRDGTTQEVKLTAPGTTPSPLGPHYTPGTKYAVVAKNEIAYQKAS